MYAFRKLAGTQKALGNIVGGRGWKWSRMLLNPFFISDSGFACTGVKWAICALFQLPNTKATEVEPRTSFKMQV